MTEQEKDRCPDCESEGVVCITEEKDWNDYFICADCAFEWIREEV